MNSSKKINQGQIEDFISDSTQAALNGKENITNKVTDFTTINDTLYPSVEAVKEQLDSKLDKVSTAGVERAYIINPDGSQGTKATSEFGVLETKNKLITIPLSDLGVAIEDVTYEMVSDYITNLGIVVEKGENYYFEVIEFSQETTDGLVIMDLTNSQPTPQSLFQITDLTN